MGIRLVASEITAEPGDDAWLRPTIEGLTIRSGDTTHDLTITSQGGLLSFKNCRLDLRLLRVRSKQEVERETYEDLAKRQGNTEPSDPLPWPPPPPPTPPEGPLSGFLEWERKRVLLQVMNPSSGTWYLYPSD